MTDEGGKPGCGNGNGNDRGTDPATDNFLPAVPQVVLDRHGGRLLDESDAIVAATWPAPKSTVYRPATLLIPDDLVESDLPAFNNVLRQIGLELIRPRPLENPFLKNRARLPRAVRLRIRDDAPKPTTVDSWTALQYLRTAANGPTPTLPRDKIRRLTVEHLVYATANFGGAPWDVHGFGGAPWDVHGMPGSSYVRSPAGGRIPVKLEAMPPARKRTVPGDLDRRPVIAVLDTGIGPHPWFGLPDRSNPPAPGSFLRVDQTLQGQIQAQNTDPPASPALSLASIWDAPVTDNPLIGDVDTATGHGTFIAGVVQQNTPDAEVLAVRVLHSDSVAREGDVLFALWWLASQVEAAQQNNDPSKMIDVISLSIGYYDESGQPSTYTGQLLAMIDWFISMGVVVVAAAGNDATSRAFYPAALSGVGPVVSVGALNPDGTRALFSNEASWVRFWEPGAAIVSTYPDDVRGAQQPDRRPARSRAGLDPDDFTAGFAVWDGTSFAAPLAAARLAQFMIDGGTLGKVDRNSTVGRAEQALKALELAAQDLELAQKDFEQAGQRFEQARRNLGQAWRNMT